MRKKLSKAIIQRTKLRNQFLKKGHQKQNQNITKKEKLRRDVSACLEKLKEIITKILTRMI